MFANYFAGKPDAARSVRVVCPARAGRHARFPAPITLVIGCALSAMVFVAAVEAASAEPAIAPGLTVRLYDSYGIPESSLKIARRTADTIFRRAGVHVGWRLCRASGGGSAAAPDRCVDTVRPTEVMMRLVPGPPSRESATRVLGYSAVDTETRRGWLSTIFPDRVALVQRGTRSISFGELLGRTLAHEMGHLLLGTTVHAKGGLMRALWTTGLLARRHQAGWHFSRTEAAQISRAVAARAGDSPVLSVAALKP